jgi:hypothetical protein
MYIYFIIAGIKERKEFLKNVLQELYCFSEGKAVAESELLLQIGFYYWKVGKGDIPQDTKADLIECMTALFPSATRTKVVKKKKNVYPCSWNIAFMVAATFTFSLFSSPELKAQVSYYDRPSSVCL